MGMLWVRRWLVAGLLAGLPAHASGALVHAATTYGDAAGAPLRFPEGVACDDAGQVVVADSAHGRLVRYAFVNGALEPRGELVSPELGYPTRLQLDSAGEVLAFDQRGRRLVRFGADQGFRGVVQPKGFPARQGFFPVAFKLDRADNVYWLDARSARVVVTDKAGAFLRELELPKGAVVVDLAVDARGTIYALDGPQAALYAAPKGSPFRALGRPLKEFVSFATYLTTTSDGGFLLVDKDGSGLVELSADGSFKGRQLSMGWSEGLLYYPAQVCVTSRREVFVADRNNHRVQAFTPVK